MTIWNRIDWLLIGAFLGMLGAATLAGRVDAQQPVASMDNLQAFAHEAITVSTAAVGVTAANIQPSSGLRTRRLLLTTTNDLRYCYDGTTPTATTCHHVTSGDSWVLTSTQDMSRLRMIREDGSDAVVAATFSR